MKVHMFWRDIPGVYFSTMQFHNRLAILTHLLVGHEVVLHYSGRYPEGDYFPDDFVKYFPGKIEIRNADEIVSVDKFIEEAKSKNIPPENYIRTSSDYWSFHLMTKLNDDEMYCDADVIALKPFPNKKWILTSDNIEDKHVTVAMMKGPKDHIIWKHMIDNCRQDWYNVQVLTKAVDYFNLRDEECPAEWFHPVCWKVAYNNSRGLHFLLNETKIPNSIGIHYYNYRLSRIQPPLDEGFIDKFPKSIFAQLCRKSFVEIQFRRK